MIGFLEGIVINIGPKALCIQTSGGVGYEVFPVGSVLAEAQLEKPIACYTQMIVRETEISLYGFAHQSEKALFGKLISISGIGPKIAIQVLSGPIDGFLAAVQSGDDAFIAQTPGIGKKMSQKIIVELQGKVDLSQAGPISPASSEALQALESLGYDKSTINEVLSQAPQGSNTETLVKFFLSRSV